MKPGPLPASGNASEIAALIETLLAAEQRIEELTAGEVDTVSGRDGRAFLLGRAQEQLRYREAANQAAAAEKMQQQQAELRVLFDVMPAMIWFKDTHNRILRVNQRVADAAGKSVKEMEGQPSAEFYPQEATKYYADDLEVIHSKAPKLGIVERLRDAHGAERWVQTDKVPVCDTEGHVTGVVVVAQDVTAPKRAAQALQSSLEEFRTLAEVVPQLVWATRPDGWNVYFNQRWTEYTGLTREESSGHGWIRPFHPDDQPRAAAAWERAVATEAAYSLEVRLRGADGIYRWWLVRGGPMKDAGGTIVKWFGTCTDIDDLKHAGLKVAESEARFAKVFHSSMMAIGISEGSSGRLIDVNGLWAQLFGYTREEMIGRTVFELGLWVDPVAPPHHLARMPRAGSAAPREAAFRRKSGEVRHALISMEEMSLEGVAEPLILAVVSDITDRKELEAQLRQSQKMDAVGRLAGGVAHDFNNMLGVILGYTELLLPQASAPQRHKLEQILKAIQSASALTHQLLAFSRKEVVEAKVLDLNALLARLETMLRPLLGEDIEFTVAPGLDLGQVKADPGQLEQVVMNLCVNARDAMPNGGMLRIETANEELRMAQTTGYELIPAGRYVRMTIADAGSGIPMDVLFKIFEPFFTTKEQGKGTGLGLAMVYGIVKQAGGYVSVDSEVGRGTTFTIYLQRIDEPVTPGGPEAAMPATGTETILLVEDQAPLREITREILLEHGYRVLDAAGPDEAVEIAARETDTIHLLLTDVVMPRMNGRALATVLTAAHPTLRVLYMSGYTADIIAHSGVPVLDIALLHKPFTTLALLGSVRTALD
jgi:two-component system, cell cycle sensor histidine kinase and response regulator CckA